MGTMFGYATLSFVTSSCALSNERALRRAARPAHRSRSRTYTDTCDQGDSVMSPDEGSDVRLPVGGQNVTTIEHSGERLWVNARIRYRMLDRLSRTRLRVVDAPLSRLLKNSYWPQRANTSCCTSSHHHALTGCEFEAEEVQAHSHHPPSRL